jgi:hypothetical protein
MERVRASADSHMKYEAYFTYILSKVEEYSILPEQTYNMDEKGIALGMMNASTRIFSRKQWDRKQVRAPIHDGSREWITILACICADGSALPPALIYQSDASNVQSSWVEDINLEQAAFVTASKSGWTNNDIGLQWLIQVFDRLTKPKARLQWRLLYVDGHASHVSVEFLDYCVKSRILVARFPPHATHTVQPLDVVVFRSLSAAYNRALTEHQLFDFWVPLPETPKIPAINQAHCRDSGSTSNVHLAPRADAQRSFLGWQSLPLPSTRGPQTLSPLRGTIIAPQNGSRGPSTTMPPL